MKKIISLLLLAVSLSTFAEEHMKFVGIPINGKLKDFGSALESRNFKEYFEDSTYYEGLFSGRDAYIIVGTTPLSKTVCEVRAVYKTETNWKDMLTIYTDVKTKLTEKYGAPIRNCEIGEKPEADYRMEDDFEKAKIVRETTFETALGYIIVGIGNFYFLKYTKIPCTYVLYKDKTNTAKFQQEAYDDL